MSAPEPTKPKVYVSALFCQLVMKEVGLAPDVIILSAIRITETFVVLPTIITPHGPDGIPAPKNAVQFYPPVKLKALITFWAETETEFTMGIRGIGPEGEQIGGEGSQVCRVGGGVLGHVMNIDLSINSDYEGTCWFEIYIDDELATKLPIRIIRQATTLDPEQYSREPSSFEDSEHPQAEHPQV